MELKRLVARIFEFANRYQLLVDEFGNSYHVFWNLGMCEISKPVGV